MATYNTTGYASSVTPSRPWQGNHYPFVIWNKIDFSDFDTNADDTDVVRALPVKAGWGVFYTVVNVTTALAGESTITANVGDGDDENGWDAAIDLTSTGYYVSAVGTDALAIGSPKLYTSDDYIDLTLTVSGSSGGIDTGVIVVSALVVDHSLTDFTTNTITTV